MMERTFHITKHVKATEEQWSYLDALVESILEKDTNKDILCVMIAYADIPNGILSDVFTPIIETKTRVSFDLEEAIVSERTIDWVTSEYPIGYDVITFWRREAC